MVGVHENHFHTLLKTNMKPEHVVPSKKRKYIDPNKPINFGVPGRQFFGGWISPTLSHFTGVLEEEVDALDFAHNVLGLAEAEPDESQAWT